MVNSFESVPLTADVRGMIAERRHLKGFDKERLQFLIECNFKAANHYEIVMLCNLMGMYIFEFEEKYQLTINNETAIGE